MAQSTIMAAATTIGTQSSGITVLAGMSVTAGLFVASGNLPSGASFPVYAETPGPGADTPIGTLTTANPIYVFPGPGTYRIVRNAVAVQNGAAIATGVYLETSAGGALPVISGGSGTTADQVQGNAANNATEAGNPVGIGGTAFTLPSTPSSATTGNRVRAAFTLKGAQYAALTDSAGTNILISQPNADAVGNTTLTLPAIAFGYEWNGATWDRRRKPGLPYLLFTSAASGNPANVKATPGEVYRVIGTCAAADVFINFFNTAGTPTVGAGTIVSQIQVTASTKFAFDLAGMYFSTGIGITLTTTAAATVGSAAAALSSFQIIYA